MSNCSCGGSCGGSCGCNVGPQIKIHDLPKGEQIVTTVKHEDIPKDKKPPPGPTVVQVLIYVYVSIAVVVTIKYIFELQAKVDLILPYPDSEWTDPPPYHPQQPDPSPYHPPNSETTPRFPCSPYDRAISF